LDNLNNQEYPKENFSAGKQAEKIALRLIARVPVVPANI
jgi:hypothetical protein